MSTKRQRFIHRNANGRNKSVANQKGTLIPQRKGLVAIEQDDRYVNFCDAVKPSLIRMYGTSDLDEIEKILQKEAV